MEGSTEIVNKLSDVDHHPSRYQGVLAVRSRWGATIYTGRNKHWLGTFDRRDEAAIAYDRASLKLQQGPVNFLTHDYSKEIRFQDMYSKKEILDMIKDHSYEANFRRFMTSLDKNNKGEGGDIERKREVLFRKQLTPSDIGKLNQLVLPKYHAERYFPLNEVHGRRDVLVFKDEKDKLWEFGYTFRRSYVLTTGWKSFVKHKDLRAGDIVCFERGNSCNIITVIHNTKGEHHVQSLQPQGESRNSNGETSSQTCPLFGLDVLHPRREG